MKSPTKKIVFSLMLNLYLYISGKGYYVQRNCTKYSRVKRDKKVTKTENVFIWGNSILAYFNAFLKTKSFRSIYLGFPQFCLKDWTFLKILFEFHYGRRKNVESAYALQKMSQLHESDTKRKLSFCLLSI